LPIPRFVSLRAGTVNARNGPGKNYPVAWIFMRRNMPVEIIAEFDTWRRIRDWEGASGWVHQSMLSGRRTILITGTQRTLRATPDTGAPGVARAEVGVIGQARKCQNNWCEVDAGSYRGWLTTEELWGVYPNEEFD
jgi:SH3-like domain-containing protein